MKSLFFLVILGMSISFVTTSALLLTFLAASRNNMQKTKRTSFSDHRLHSVYDARLKDKTNEKSSTVFSKGSKKKNDIPQKMVQLLEKMITRKEFTGSSEFLYDDTQIDEKIKQYKIDLNVCDKDTGLLLLRVAISLGRRDVCKILLKHGASSLSSDKAGLVFYEALLSDKAGSLHMLTDLLANIPPEQIQIILRDKNKELSRASKAYWLNRGLKNAFPQEKLEELGLARLNALKFKIVGQSFALEQILAEVTSFNVNTELSAKPLVMLFSGTLSSLYFEYRQRNINNDNNNLIYKVYIHLGYSQQERSKNIYPQIFIYLYMNQCV